ncbi:MAG: response regulator [Candidatus Latescibacteria bacterium]|nr:response regulator [Candidatus Latescibacterota bacterium]
MPTAAERLSAVLLVVLGLHLPALAHNGAVAVALPVERIVVDGDLSDWPGPGRWYPIDILAAGTPPKSGDDFTGRWRVGYNAAERALYLAVEVRDESSVITPDQRPEWSIQDGCQIYLDAGHEGKSALAQYTVYGNTRNAYTKGGVITLEGRAEAQLAICRSTGAHQYEWRIDIVALSKGTVSLRPGTYLGLGVAANDVDQDGSVSWLGWGSAITDHFRPGDLPGDVILARAAEELGRIEGQAHWEDAPEAAGYARVKFQRVDDPDQQVAVRTDRQGWFEAELPAGAYHVLGSKGTIAEVKPGDHLAVSVPLTTPARPKVKVGPGRTTRAGPGIHQGLWHTLTIPDGIPAEVRAITQGPRGDMWFGSVGRLVCYDGEWCREISRKDGLPDEVESLHLDQRGNLWIGTLRSGLIQYDGEYFTFFNSEGELINDSVCAIVEDQRGNLWIGTRGGGISRYDGRHFSHFTAAEGLANNSVQALYLDRAGDLWAGTRYGGVSRCDGERFTTFTAEDGLGNNSVLAIQEDEQGRLWFGTEANGVSRFDGKHFTRLTKKEGLAEDWIYTIHQDKSGNLWFGSKGGGVSRYDGKRFTTFTRENGLEGETVWAICEDQEGNLWFGTSEGGVSRYQGAQFTTFTAADGLAHNSVWAAVEDREGNLWFGTRGGGVSRYDGSGFTTFSREQGLPHTEVRAMKVDREGRIWFGMEKAGVSCYDGDQWQTLTTAEGLVNDDVTAIYQDRQGSMWFGTEKGGVSCYAGGHFANFTTENGLPDNTVHAIGEDRQGELWVGTAKGASRYRNGQFSVVTRADGGTVGSVYAICTDQEGYLWLGTGEGLTRYDGTSFTSFTPADGLPAGPVRIIYEDRQGHLWFGTYGGGVGHYDGQVFQRLSRRDGLAQDCVLAVLQDRRGDLWFATLGGVTRYRPYSVSPPVLLQEVVADQPYGPVSQIRLPTTQDYLSFIFRSASFRYPENTIYRYRLQGYDGRWSSTRTHKVEYQDLPRGNYTFEVEAVDRDLVYSEKPATVQVEVHLPYGQLSWGFALILALALVVYQTRRVLHRDQRLRAANQALGLRAEELEESRQAAEAASQAKSLFLANMSHEIRTPMNAILGYAQVLQRSLGSEHRRALQSIQQSGDHLLGLLNEVLDLSRIEAGRMQLQVGGFDLQRLLGPLGEMFESYCRDKGLVWKLERLPEKQALVQGDETKLRQVLINLLGNAAKFTQEGEVRLLVERRPRDHYYFEVRDTGPGMSPEDQVGLFQPFRQGSAGLRQGGTGLGLALAQRQLELMGSRLAVETAPGKGARFFFTVELPPAQGAVQVDESATFSRVKRLAPGQQVRALVADDVAENREVLRRMLEEIGVIVEAVENGQQALERVVRFRPDIVLLDIRMPVLDGMATLRRLQEMEARERIKVVAISASVLAHQQQGFLEAGFDAFLDKPFRFEKVYSCLARLLGVQYEYEPESEEEVATEAPDWSSIAVPTALHRRLQEAAELYSVTELEEELQELEQLGADQRQLAAHLRGLKQRQDMEGILTLLAKVHRE